MVKIKFYMLSVLQLAFVIFLN